MFKLLKGGHCFIPKDIGIRDVLIFFDKICTIESQISEKSLAELEVIDCHNCLVCPGFIDQHVHITGGGGEEGPASRIPELMLSDITTAGVTTLVGVLGFDSITRNITGLLAKARALEIEGLTTFIYTGSYSVPAITLTGRVLNDVAILDKVIGAGEIAIADYRTPHLSLQGLQELASEVKVGGMLGSKAGILHFHVGDEKEGLEILFQLIDKSAFPIKMFVPTHINRNKRLFQQGITYLKKGGYIDLTAGETAEKGYDIPESLEILTREGFDLRNVTVSSDGNGSIPIQRGGMTGIGKVRQLFEDLRTTIVEKNIPVETVLQTVTSNPAKLLNLYPQKGLLARGSDADILVLRKDDYDIQHLIIKGITFIKEGKVIKKGRYEK
ncbi:MAG: beta-aspartyl-peptidase [Bacillota bacterium]